MRRGIGGGLDPSEYQTKFILERINATDKHLAHLNLAVSALIKQESRVRDKEDGIAKIMAHYSETEAFNLTLAQGVGGLAKAMTLLADLKDIEVRRLATKVTAELEQYETVCKRMREQVKEAMMVRDKELNRQRRLSNSGRKMVTVNFNLLRRVLWRSSHTTTIQSLKFQPELEADLLKATLDVNRTLKEIEDLLESFEQRKLQDVKQILMDFILIQLKTHTSATEVLSSVYRDIAEIDEKADLQVFCKYFRLNRIRYCPSESLISTSRLALKKHPSRRRYKNPLSRRKLLPLTRLSTSLESWVQYNPFKSPQHVVFGPQSSTMLANNNSLCIFFVYLKLIIPKLNPSNQPT